MLIGTTFIAPRAALSLGAKPAPWPGKPGERSLLRHVSAFANDGLAFGRREPTHELHRRAVRRRDHDQVKHDAQQIYSAPSLAGARQAFRRLKWNYAWDQFITLGKERGPSHRQPKGGLPVRLKDAL
jgi:hypothetical protein